MEEDADSLPLFFGIAAAVKKKGSGAVRPQASAISGRVPPGGQRGADPDAPRGRADVAQGSRGPQGARGVAQEALRRPPGLRRGRRQVPGRVGAGPVRGRGPHRALAPLHSRRDLLHAGTRRGTPHRNEAGSRRDAPGGPGHEASALAGLGGEKPRRAARDALSSAQGRRSEDSHRSRRKRSAGGAATAARELRRQVDRAGGAGSLRGPGPGGEVVRVLVGRPQAQAGPGLGQRQVGLGRLERERGRRRGQRAPGVRKGDAGRRRSSWRGSMRSAPRRWRL